MLWRLKLIKTKEGDMRNILLWSLLILLLVGCESNPLLKIDIKKFNEVLQRSEFSDLSKLCSAYYIRDQRLKVTRESQVCSTFTRDLVDLFMKEGIVQYVTYKDFRDKRVWKAWTDYLRKKSEVRQPKRRINYVKKVKEDN